MSMPTVTPLDVWKSATTRAAISRWCTAMIITANMLLLRLHTVLSLAIVVASYAKNETVTIKKNVYLLCVSLENFIRMYEMPAILQFSLDVVENRTDLLPGYNLQIICGFTQEFVSVTIFYVSTSMLI